MSPEVIEIIRLTIRIAVVLPQPEGPTSTQISPAGTVNESLSTAGSACPGYTLVASRNSSVAASRPAPWSGVDWAVVTSGAPLGAPILPGRSPLLRGAQWRADS